MISPKLLQSNVLRRIYKDSTFEAAQLRDRSHSQLLAGDRESADTLWAEAVEHGDIVRAVITELSSRGEPFN